MPPDELAQQIVTLSVTFGPLVVVLMELVVKRWVVRPESRKLASGALAIILPALYMLATGALEPRAAPLVMALAWCISQVAHAGRNAVDRMDAERKG